MVLASSSLLLLSTAAWLAPPAALSVAPAHIGHAPSTAYRHGARTAPARLSAGSSAGAGSTDDSSLFAALRARQAELADERAQLAARWREGQCQSSVRLNLHDWIRRLALSWPMVALGTASGGVYVCDLSSGKLLAGELNAHPAYLGGQEAELELLHGEYDGGGITALAFDGCLVLSGGRDGCAKLYRFVSSESDTGGAEQTLESLGTLECGGIVSAVAFSADGKRAYTGSTNGQLRYWSLEADGAPTCVSMKEMGSAILCMNLLRQGQVLVGLGGGSAAVASADLSEVETWEPHAPGHTRSIAEVHGSVVTGGSDGIIKRRWLRPTPSEIEEAEVSAPAELFADEESAPAVPQELSPAHNGAIVAIAAREDGMMISGAQDGTLRVWDMGDLSTRVELSGGGLSEQLEVASPTGRALYGLAGYKVWLGSVSTDGTRLVSDGQDNRVIVHDFSPGLDGDL